MDAPKTLLSNSSGHKYSTLLLVGGIFILILGGLFFTINQVGNAYKKNLAAIPDTQSPEYSLQKKRTVKKITIKRSDESGCLEVSPDGVVRIYETCGGELTSASRLTDVKNIQKLFTIVTDADLALYNKGTGTLYELILETDSGTQRMIVVVGGTQTPGVSEIIQTIIQITGDLPTTSPTPTPRPIGPSPSITPFSSPSPTPGQGGSTFPSPTPPGGSEKPFTCDFSESGKPIRVSNVVCTSAPR